MKKLSDHLQQLEKPAHKPFLRPHSDYSLRVCLQLVDRHSPCNTRLDPHTLSAAVAAQRPGRCLSAPRLAYLPWAGEGLHVCCSKRDLHGLPKRDSHILPESLPDPGFHPLPPSQHPWEELHYQLTAPHLPCPQPAQTFACSRLLGPSLMQSPGPGRR